jgi:hypothetical protein
MWESKKYLFSDFLSNFIPSFYNIASVGDGEANRRVRGSSASPVAHKPNQKNKLHQKISYTDVGWLDCYVSIP